MTDKIIKWEGHWDAPVQNQQNFAGMLGSKEQALIGMIPESSGLDLVTLTTTALECAIDNAALLQCSTISLFMAVKKAAEFGLSLSKELGHGYLVPYYNSKKKRKDAQLIIGYKGWVELVYRATRVTMIDSGIVYKGDTFNVEKGTTPNVTHIVNIATSHKDADITHFYSVAYFPDAPPRFEVMTLEEVKGIRSRSKSGSRGPWQTDFGQMGCKTAFLRLRKNLPTSRVGLFARALDHEYKLGGIRNNVHALPEISSQERMERMQRRIEGGPVKEEDMTPEIKPEEGDGPEPPAEYQPEFPPEYYQEGNKEESNQ